jgi:hypothetical protein
MLRPDHAQSLAQFHELHTPQRLGEVIGELSSSTNIIMACMSVLISRDECLSRSTLNCFQIDTQSGEG